MRLPLLLAVITLLLLIPTSPHPLTVTNPLRDFLFYFNNPTLMTLLSAFGNLFWGLFLGPWVGARSMIQAQLDYNTNPGLHQFLEYTVDDFYVMRMQEEK